MLLQALSSPVLAAVGERYYKVTAEALRVCGELVRVLRPSVEVRMFSILCTSGSCSAIIKLFKRILCCRALVLISNLMFNQFIMP